MKKSYVLKFCAALLLSSLAVAEKEKPEADRIASYRDTAGGEQRLFATDQKINKEDDIAAMAVTLAEMNKFIPGNPIVAKAISGRSPAQAAREIISNTKIDDVEFRKQLYSGGKSAVDSSTDPLIALVRAAEAEAVRINDEYARKVAPLEA